MTLRNFIADKMSLFRVLLDGGCSLTKNDAGFWCTDCPLCKELGCRLTLYPDTHSFGCSMCKESGNVVKFICLFAPCSVTECEEYLVRKYNLKHQKKRAEKIPCSGKQDRVTITNEISH